MKKILFIISLLFVTGCFQDKAEKVITNCADSRFSKELVNRFDPVRNVHNVFDGWVVPKNIFGKKIATFKKAGFEKYEIILWAEDLNTVEKGTGNYDLNKDVIDFLLNEKNRINNELDKIFNSPVTDRLKNSLYEYNFKNCEKKRNETSKTFDLKWEKPQLLRVKFRD